MAEFAIDWQKHDYYHLITWSTRSTVHAASAAYLRAKSLKRKKKNKMKMVFQMI